MDAKRQYVGRVTKTCEQCGVDVTRKASSFKPHVFCSRDCYLGSDYFKTRRDASTHRRFAGRRVERPCRQCQRPVVRAISQFNSTTFCSVACRRSHAVDRGTRQLNSNGYVVIFVGKGHPGAGVQGHILEHRKVMQEHLGRPLTDDENVHHKNGDRADNRLDNLELWSTSQPCGQRVTDKLAWAREFITRYESLGI